MDEQVKRSNYLREYFAERTSRLAELDEALVQRRVKLKIIWGDRIDVELKSGVNIDVDA